ncbi:type IV secretory system conjugative DNA transfer family protein [Flindersiella endophytica]
MGSTLVALVVGLGLLGSLLAARYAQALLWRRQLVAYRLHPPKGLDAATVTAWLGMLAPVSRWSPVAVEIVATHKEIGFYVLMALPRASTVTAQLRTALPGSRIEEAPDYLSSRPRIRAAVELRLSSLLKPLAHDRAETAVTALFSGLHPFARGEVVRLQLLLSGTRALRPRQNDPAELAASLRKKNAAPAFDAVMRVAASAPSAARASNLLSRVVDALRVMDAPGASVVRRTLPWSMVATRVYKRAIPLTVWPMRLNALEAPAFAGLCLGGSYVPGLSLSASRQLPPPDGMSTRGVIVAESTFPGMEKRKLTLTAEDRTRHSLLIGPTGVGKSTLIASMAISDITEKRGVLVVDPKADLNESILSRLPEEDKDRVIVLDAAATKDHVVGFNLLRANNDEQSRELAVDNVTHILRSLWADSWGPRSDQYLRAGLLALVHARATDGSAFTLADLPVLLEHDSFRRQVLAQPTMPEQVRRAWASFENRSDAEKTTIVAPLLNKLGAFTLRSSLRLILGQSEGINFDDLFAQRRCLLVSLRKDAIGQDSAQLLGALLVASMWQATLRRARIPAERRHPYMVFLDEFQDVVRLPLDLSDMLAQSRSFGVGLHLAHQYIDQLPRAVQAAVRTTVRTHVSFQLSPSDARTLAPMFAPLSADDLTNLPTYEVALKPCVNGATASVATGRTLPLPEPVRDAQDLAEQSRQRFGMPRAEIEAGLRARVEVSRTKGRFGRSSGGGAG